RLRSTSDVHPTVVSTGDHALLLVEGSGQSVVDLVVNGGTAERQVVGGCLARPQEPADVVVEHGSRSVRSAEVDEGVRRHAARRAERVRRHAARAPDALELRFRPRALESQAVAVREAATGAAALGGDDDGTIGRVDSVECSGFRTLQYRSTLDVRRIWGRCA